MAGNASAAAATTTATSVNVAGVVSQMAYNITANITASVNSTSAPAVTVKEMSASEEFWE